jgi:hypothetical protein
MKAILSVLTGAALVIPSTSAFADKGFHTGKGATWDCAHDPEVTINTSGGTYTLKGACKDVDVHGSNLTITADSVKDLTVNGGGNMITLGAVADITVNGGSNTLTYATSLRGKSPNIRDRGRKNSITVAGPPAPPAPPKGDGTASARAAEPPATILDCASIKHVSISQGSGSYRVTGTCEKISVAGGSNLVTIAAVKNLAITGSNNELLVERADKIAVMGSSNRVIYGGGLTAAEPKVASMGKSNVVTRGESTPVVPPAVRGSSPSTSAVMTIDCTTMPTHRLDDNHSSYSFTGTCEALTILGNHVTVEAEGAKRLSVAGNHNRIAVTAVDKLTVQGNDNNVVWQRGLASAKAKISVLGKRNAVAQRK